MTERRLRVAVIGATGALGTEVLSVLDQRRFPASGIVPVATERSLGVEVEVQGASYPVSTEAPRFEELDLVFLCAPAAASAEYVREAGRHDTVVLDLSGALADDPDVPFVVMGLGTAPAAFKEPVVATPAGPALETALVLGALDRAAGVQRALATVLEPVSSVGVRGIDALQAETVALFNQEEPPESGVFPQPVAFDCLPAVGGVEADGRTPPERELARDVRRLVGGHVRLAATIVQVPTFAGGAVTLAVETERPLAARAAHEVLSEAPGVELWGPSSEVPTTRATAGRDAVLVGRLRDDPSKESGLLLWLAADTLQLAASNAVKLAEARLLAS